MHIRIPNDFGEAAKGYENALNGCSDQRLNQNLLLLKLVANVYRPQAGKGELAQPRTRRRRAMTKGATVKADMACR